MLSEKSSPTGKSDNATCCELVALKHLIKILVEHNYFAIFCKRKTLRISRIIIHKHFVFKNTPICKGQHSSTIRQTICLYAS